MKISKMIILRLIYSMTRLNEVANSYIRCSQRVTDMIGKINENILRWFEHVEKRHNDEMMDEIQVKKTKQGLGHRRNGRI